MAVRTRASALLPSDEPDETESVALVPAVRPEIATRHRLARTPLVVRPGGSRTDAGGAARVALASRHPGWLRRRRNRALAVVAVALALFPPMWAVYLIGWLVWRSRPRQQSMRRVRQAVRALQRKRTGPALKKLQEAHFVDPTNTDALYWLGLLLSRQHRQEEAEEALSLVAERVPGLPEVEAALVEAYVAMEQPESAIYHAQRLYDAAPYATASLLKLADAFEAAGRADLAVEALERAPLHLRTLTDDLLDVHYRLGALHEHLGDRERALTHFKQVYARDIAYRDVRARVLALEARSDP